MDGAAVHSWERVAYARTFEDAQRSTSAIGCGRQRQFPVLFKHFMDAYYIPSRSGTSLDRARLDTQLVMRTEISRKTLLAAGMSPGAAATAVRPIMSRQIRKACGFPSRALQAENARPVPAGL